MSEALETTFCVVHPDRETALRCNRCDRYRCTQCAVCTPVGYRCRECLRAQEDKFFTGTTTDYLIVAGACTVMGAIGGAAMAFMPLGFYLAFFAGAPAGAMVAQIALYVTFKRRRRCNCHRWTGRRAVPRDEYWSVDFHCDRRWGCLCTL